MCCSLAQRYDFHTKYWWWARLNFFSPIQGEWRRQHTKVAAICFPYFYPNNVNEFHSFIITINDNHQHYIYIRVHARSQWQLSVIEISTLAANNYMKTYESVFLFETCETMKNIKIATSKCVAHKEYDKRRATEIETKKGKKTIWINNNNNNDGSREMTMNQLSRLSER